MEKIIFFDGECGLCNKSVLWIMNKDSSHQFTYASLGGKTASKLLLNKKLKNQLPDSIIYLREGRIFVKSAAILTILKDLGFPFSILGNIGQICPVMIRDFVYDQVAKYRKKILPNACPFPTDKKIEQKFLP